jgi:hypothetical protein
MANNSKEEEALISAAAAGDAPKILVSVSVI